MKTLRAALVALVALTLPGFVGSSFAAGPAPAACPGAPLLRALEALRSGPELKVQRLGDRVTVHDRVRDRLLLVVTCEGVEVAGPSDARRPAAGAPATTEVVRDASGAVLYSHSVTPLGARVTLIPAGRFARDGLDLTVFDDDGVYLADGRGALIFQRQTTPEGALVEREGQGHGCGCERVTGSDGQVAVRPLTAASAARVERAPR